MTSENLQLNIFFNAAASNIFSPYFMRKMCGKSKLIFSVFVCCLWPLKQKIPIISELWRNSCGRVTQIVYFNKSTNTTVWKYSITNNISQGPFIQQIFWAFTLQGLWKQDFYLWWSILHDIEGSWSFIYILLGNLIQWFSTWGWAPSKRSQDTSEGPWDD